MALVGSLDRGCNDGSFSVSGYPLRLLALMVMVVVGCGRPADQQALSPQAMAQLPDISTFLTQPSDRFLVDVEEISRGDPFLGLNSAHPHSGAHVHFDNTKNRWPKGKDESVNYPAIYAVADGVVSRVDTRFGLPGANERPASSVPVSKSLDSG
jgi:hypothetical protein